MGKSHHKKRGSRILTLPRSLDRSGGWGLVADRIVALRLNSLPEGLVVVVPGSIVLRIEREGVVLVPVAVAAYMAVAVIFATVVLFRIRPAGIGRLTGYRKREGCEHHSRTQKEPRTHK
jgi:hypothetical protein